MFGSVLIVHVNSYDHALKCPVIFGLQMSFYIHSFVLAPAMIILCNAEPEFR